MSSHTWEPRPLHRPGPTVVAMALIVLGGALALIGSFLPWFHLERILGGFTQNAATVHGLRVAAGWIALALGIVSVALGFTLVDVRARGRGKAAALGALIAGVIVLVWAIVQWNTEQSKAIDDTLALLAPARRAVVRALLGRLFHTGALRITAASGLYLAVAGGAFVAIGALVALLARPAGTLEPQPEPGWAPPPVPWYPPGPPPVPPSPPGEPEPR
jgi:hypothetical protein